MTNERNAPVPMPVAMILAQRLDGATRMNEAKMREAVKDVIAQLIDSTRVPAYASPPAAGDADWVMVPREATHEMKAAGMETSPMYQVLGTGRRVSVSDEDAGAIYAAMLAAAPKPAAPPSVTDAVALDKLRGEMLRHDADETHPYIVALDRAIAALTHPGHKHAQEDAAQEGARGEELVPWRIAQQAVHEAYNAPRGKGYGEVLDRMQAAIDSEAK